jgi:hypothetical protein
METEYTTVRIDRAAHSAAKSAAAKERKLLQDFIRDALMSSAARVEAGSKGAPKTESPTN